MEHICMEPQEQKRWAKYRMLFRIYGLLLVMLKYTKRKAMSASNSLRLIPADIDISTLNPSRKNEAEAARKMNKEKESEETSLPANDSKVCTCHLKSDSTSKRRKVCPIGEKDTVKFPEGGNHYYSLNSHYLSLTQVMGIGACYLPMLNESYVFDKIFMAAISGQSREREFMQLIYECGVGVDHRDSDGNTALMLACAAKPHSSLAIEFVLSKASKEYINAVNHDGLAALHFATMNYLPEVVEKLLDLGADPDAGRVYVDGRYFGLTPVLICVNARFGNENRCLETLLNYDADISVELAKPVDAVESLNFLMECSCGGCTSCKPTTLSRVLAPSKIRTHDFEPAGNALFHSVRRCLFVETTLLLDKCEEKGQLQEALKEPTFEDGLTPFAIATKYVHANIMQVMIEKDPSVVNQVLEYRGKQLMTPLHMILSKQRLFGKEFNHLMCGKPIHFTEDFAVKVISVLLDAKNINLQACNGNQETPIILAVKNGHDYVTEKMVNLGANVFNVDERGNCPLSLAMSLEPTVRLQMFKIMFKTGLSHEIYKHNIRHSMLLNDLLATKDLKLFQLFCKTGAINSNNRIQMYELAQKMTGWPSPEEKNRYLKVVGDTTPRPLQEMVAVWLSAQVGLRTPKSHALALQCSINNIKFIQDVIGESQDDDHVHNKDQAVNKAVTTIANEAENEMGAVIEEEAEDEMEAMIADEADDEVEAMIADEADDEVEAMIADEAEDEVEAMIAAEAEVEAMSAAEADNEVKAVSEEKAENEVVAKKSDVAHNANEQNFWKIYKCHFKEVALV